MLECPCCGYENEEDNVDCEECGMELDSDYDVGMTSSLSPDDLAELAALGFLAIHQQYTQEEL